MPAYNTIIDAIKKLGWVKGVFALFFFMAHAWIYALYMGRIKDRQNEIDRLAKENHDYRHKFLRMLDEQHAFTARGKKA